MTLKQINMKQIIHIPFISPSLNHSDSNTAAMTYTFFQIFPVLSFHLLFSFNVLVGIIFS